MRRHVRVVQARGDREGLSRAYVEKSGEPGDEARKA